MGTWEHINLGEFPWHNALGFFFVWGGGGGRSLKIHTELFFLKGGVVYVPKQYKLRTIESNNKLDQMKNYLT
jgi:hypothetical protein